MCYKVVLIETRYVNKAVLLSCRHYKTKTELNTNKMIILMANHDKISILY